MIVPFVDLRAQYLSMATELDEAMRRVVADADFILGKDLAAFEAEFAAYCGTRFAVGVDSGLSALEIALRALGVGPGDEVITVACTFLASAAAISAVGARPVFVDVERDTCLMDAGLVEAAITARTKAILPVHLYGQPVDVRAIRDVADRHGLPVVEDACQAHGATYRGARAGSLGQAGCFSFYPAKNLGGYGDGGMLVTDDERIAQHARLFRNYGQSSKNHHAMIGFNRRLDTLQAAVLRVKLPHLDTWNEARMRAAARYDEGLSDVPGLRVPARKAERTHVYHLYVIEHPERDRLAAHLKAHGIATGLHYPTPVHLQPCYAAIGPGVGALPVTESIMARVLSLPMFPSLDEGQIRYVCDRIHEFPAG